MVRFWMDWVSVGVATTLISWILFMAVEIGVNC